MVLGITINNLYPDGMLIFIPVVTDDIAGTVTSRELTSAIFIKSCILPFNISKSFVSVSFRPVAIYPTPHPTTPQGGPFMSEILLTPLLQSQPPFDPRDSRTFPFAYDGNQVFRNRLVITDNETLKDVYDDVQIGMKLNHTVPAGTLSSNRQYLAKVKVYDDSGNESEFSSPIKFYCFTTPEFYFQDLASDNTIHCANLNVTLSYSQPENEPIQQYRFELYQNDRTLLYTSNVFYGNELTHTFYGLKNNETYYIRAVCVTQHGMSADTGFIKINVEYVMIPANVIFKAENNYDNGYISLESGIIDIGYTVDNDNYSFAGGEVTLTDNRVTYNSGFEIPDDFCVYLKARKLPLGDTFFIMPQDNGDIGLSIVKICREFYCRLSVPSPAGVYTRYAPLPRAVLADENNALITDTQDACIMLTGCDYFDGYVTVFELKRKNGFYSLKTYYEPNGIIVI